MKLWLKTLKDAYTANKHIEEKMKALRVVERELCKSIKAQQDSLEFLGEAYNEYLLDSIKLKNIEEKLRINGKFEWYGRPVGYLDKMEETHYRA